MKKILFVVPCDYEILSLYTTAAASQVDLTYLGIEQAKKLGQSILSNHQVNYIFSASNKSSMRTACIISNYLRLQVVNMDAFNEINISQSPITLKKVQHSIMQMRNDTGVCFPTGETYRNAFVRITRGVDEVLNSMAEDSFAVIVTNKHILRCWFQIHKSFEHLCNISGPNSPGLNDASVSLVWREQEEYALKLFDHLGYI